VRESIEGMMLEVIFDIRPKLPDWSSQETLERVSSESVDWLMPEHVVLSTETGRSAKFRTSAVRLLTTQFRSATWCLSPPDPRHGSSVLIGTLNAISHNGENVTRYLMLAPKTEPKQGAQ